MADIYLKKEDLELDLLFDMVVENNDLQTDNTYVTASLLSIFTDASQPQIGTQIDGKILGNKNYNLDKLNEENIKAYEDGLKESLQWLLDDKIVTNIQISTEKNGNRLDIKITFTTDSENEDNLIYSLDEKLEILGEEIEEVADILYIINGGSAETVESITTEVDGGNPNTISLILDIIDGGILNEN